MNETTTKERADIVTTLIVAGVLAAIVLVTTWVRWVETFTAAGLAVPVPFARVPVDLAPASDLPQTPVDVTQGVITADGVNAVSTASLGASIILGGLVWLAVIALFAVLALRFLRGRFFDRTNPVLLDAAAWTMLGGALVVYLLDMFGRNGVLAASGLTDYSPDSWALAGPFIVVWIGAMVLGLVSLAFRRGIRLQRDTEGLV